MAEVQVDGKRAFYTTGGKAWEDGLPLLVFIHCAGGAQTMWILQSRAIAHHGWNVAALDLPGHGNSEDVAGMERVEDYAAWVGRFVSALGVEQVALAGHSMGAGIALTLAATSPAQVAALLLLGTRAEMEVAPTLLKDTAENPLRAAQFITAFGHAPSTHIGLAPTPGSWLLGTAQALIERCSSEVLHRDFQASQDWDGTAYADKAGCPTMVIAGALDRMTPAAMGRKLAGSIPGARYEELPAVGHFMMSEAPREVLKLMRGFLDDVKPAPA